MKKMISVRTVLSHVILASLTLMLIHGAAFGMAMEKKKMDIRKEKYGRTPDGQEVFRYTLTNGVVTAKIITYGGIVTELWTPDRKGNVNDIVLGFDSLQGYLAGHPYFGAIVGRYANRIAKGRFTLDGVEYKLATNNNENHLHGGIVGFDKVVWDAEPEIKDDRVSLKLKYTSKDGEEGYPGNLSVAVVYSLNKNNELSVSYEARTDKPTVVNPTQHSYFNMAGTGNALGHLVTINADRYTVVDKTLIPTGELRPVEGTPMDFRKPHSIGERIPTVEGGYDHNYVLNRKGKGLSLAARVLEPQSGRVLELSTTEPGLQFYSGNFLDGSLKGKGGVKYEKHSGFCLEAQHFPDSPNHPEFPSVVLRPGQTYRQETVFKFTVAE
jgi:aldose 1-epimerase